MRGRLLAAFALALASVSVWAIAIPFATTPPVAIAYNGASSAAASFIASAAPEQTLRPVATSDGSLAHSAALRIDSRSFVESQPTDQPIDPTATPVPLDPNDQPTDQPTDKPDRTDTPTTAPAPTPEPTPRPTARPTDPPSPSPTPRPTAEPTPKPTATPAPEPTPKPTTPPTTFSGTSHLWYPALNIDAGWSWYGCDHGGDPDGLGAGVYRWGCGPASNTYLLGHAWSTFKKIRTAYHSGALQVGQSVWYADAQGDVSQWQVTWIRRVTVEYLNATAGDWALNDSPTPIMTLQTCDGSQSQMRIIVRLVPAN
jgi:hypothetical protein